MARVIENSFTDAKGAYETREDAEQAGEEYKRKAMEQRRDVLARFVVGHIDGLTPAELAWSRRVNRKASGK